MMKRLTLFVLLLVAPQPVFAASFTATVDNNHVVAGEGFALQLNLSGADAKGDPDLATLKQSFDIVGQEQTSSTTIINGQMSSSSGWQLALIPKQTGHITVPPVAVDTDVGQLSTQPITLDVGQEAASQSSQSSPVPAAREITINASANLTTPYQDQPVIYTLRIVAHDDISGLSLGDVTADNAIVQPQGEAESKDATENGVPVKIIEMHYLVTPLKSGPVTIAPVTMQGSLSSSPPMSHLGGMGNGFIDPMTIFRQMDNFGFMQSKPFSIESNAVTLNVKAPAVTMNPWLPLKNLLIKETIDSGQTIKVGDPIARKFTLLADGMVGSQLPTPDMQLKEDDFKVYSDKPKIIDSINKKNGDIIGQREETFSLIPLKPGSLTLPEIKIPWWDVKNDRIAYAVVPARTIEVLPAPAASNLPPQNEPGVQANTVAPSSSPALTRQVTPTSQIPSSWYALVALLVLVVLAVTAWAIKLQRKITRQNSGEDIKDRDIQNTKPKSQAEIKWDQIGTAEALNRSLLTYAHDRWGTPQNAALETIFLEMSTKLSNVAEQKEIEMITRELSRALYANKPINLDDIKSRCRRVIAALNEPDKEKKKLSEKLPRLNPS